MTKILIVEDERLAAEDLSLRLSRLGYDIVGIASDCPDAVELARVKTPHVILMDIQLRGKIDGIETARRIHEFRPIPIIFTTAFGDDEHVLRAMEVADPYGFLHKPIDEHAVNTLIKIALSRFVKDQHILRINDLLQVKTEIFEGIESAVNSTEIMQTLSGAFSKSNVIHAFWMMCLDTECKVSIDPTYEGIDQDKFERYKSEFDLHALNGESKLNLDDRLSELTGMPFYYIPILGPEMQIMGVIGLSLEADLTLHTSETNVLIDISFLISHKLREFNVNAQKELAEKQIQESESRLRAIVEKSTTGIYLIDNTMKFEYVNDRLCEIFGRPREEVVGHAFTEFLGKSLELTKDRYRRRQAGEDVPSEYEIDVVRPNGEVRDLILSANAFVDAHGNTKSAGHLLDITEQNIANLQLTKLSKAIEQSPVMVLITDDEGNIEYVNSQFTHTMGYTREEVLGQNPRIFKSGNFKKEYYKKMWDDILNGETWIGEFTNLKKNGELVWDKSSISPVLDGSGNITHFVAVKEDITQLKAEQAESVRNQMLRDVIYDITTTAMRTKDISQLYENIFNSLSEIISTSNFLMALLDRESNTLYFPFDRDSKDVEMPDRIPCDPETSLTARTVVEGRTVHLGEHELREFFAAGKVLMAGAFPSVWLGVPLRVDDEVIGAIVLQEYGGQTSYDDQDVRMLEVAAGQVALALERMRKEEALRNLAEELSNANSLKELLLDVITHDLRNPAGVISAITEMLEDDENEMFEILKGSSNSLMKVIENATVLSKLSLGESIAKEEMDLVEVIKEVASEFTSQLSNAGMSIKLNLPEKFMYDANPIISEIPKNFISNAIKYASSGKIVEISLREEDGRPILCIEDYGTPIPRDKWEAVFERSVQLSEGKKHGRGLGLAIVKRIAEEHAAEAGVQLAQTGGNCFYLKM